VQDIDWSDFFGRYRPMALSFVRGWVERHDVAEDLFQEAAHAVYERASRGRIDFQSSAHLRNYFFRTLKNLAVNVLRDPRGRTAAIEEMEPVAGRDVEPLESLISTERTRGMARRDQAVKGALSMLKPLERQALHMRFHEGLGFREMANRTGCSISTLHSRVEAGLKKIRKKIGNDGMGM
jgi:RNA polymerase sigma-70 factor (ECF subfamily)